LAGGAVVNAFARQVGAAVPVVDVGVAASLAPAPGLVLAKIRPGTADMTTGPALTLDEARAAVDAGVMVAERLIDGGARVLVAAALAPDAIGAMVAGHRSAEPGATVGLAHLGLTPLVDLGLRLGEGTGAVLALPIVAGAVRVLHEVATFDSAGVSEK